MSPTISNSDFLKRLELHQEYLATEHEEGEKLEPCSTTDFLDVNFNFLDLTAVDFGDNKFFKKTFNGTVMRGVYLSETEFTECEFVDVDFRYADFEHVTFNKCTFQNCRFNGIKNPESASYVACRVLGDPPPEHKKSIEILFRFNGKDELTLISEETCESFKVGCEEFEIEGAQGGYKELGRVNDYTDEEIAAYGAIIDAVCKIRGIPSKPKEGNAGQTKKVTKNDDGLPF